MAKTLRTESGAPVADNQRSQTAGPGGPVLLQDQHLLEKLARFNRERIPERIVHAVGSGAYGHFTVTNPEIAHYTRMRMMSASGKRTEIFARFSTVAGSRGAPDTARDPRGFALKFYTEEGNWDLAGNNTPIFFSATRSGFRTSSTARSRIPTPTSRSPRTSGTSSPGPPRPPTSSPGCSATAASRPRTGTWTASARTPSSG